MLRSFASSLLVVWPLLLVATQKGCGTSVETSPATTSTGSHAAGAGGSGANGGATGGEAASGGGGVTGGQGAGATGGGPSLYPPCEQRGGSCVLVDALDSPCPAGSYDPFSGEAAFCPTNGLRRCCVPTGGVGSTCTQADPCDGGGCLAEDSGYPTGGFCSTICEPESPGCPAWATCLPVFFSQAMGMCMVSCEHDGMCREGWSCQAFSTQPFTPNAPTTYVCWQVGNPMSSGGLGQICQSPDDCLSSTCKTDPNDATSKCTATCDDAHACLPGFNCLADGSCPTPGCGFCFAA